MNSTIDERTTDERNLDEPHFDEEATILAARPVVPLDEVRTARRPKWALALAIVGGLIIGLLAATLIFRYVDANQTTAVEPTPMEAQPANQLPTSAGGVAGSIAEAEPTPIEEDDVAVVGSDDRDHDPKPEKSRSVSTEEDRAPEAPRRPVIVTESRTQVDDEEEEIEAAMRRAARQEERRERRRAARQAKRQERPSTQQPDDLTRIREIFEGSPKP